MVHLIGRLDGGLHGAFEVKQDDALDYGPDACT